MARTPPLVIAGCIQVKLGFIIGGQGAYNILHFTKAGTDTIDQVDAESIGAAAKTAWTANLAPLCPPNVALARVSVRDLSAPNLPEFFDSAAAVGGTESTGEPLPAGVALCVTLRTAGAGKKFRGRVYIGGFSETQNTNTGTSAPAAGAAAVEFLSDLRDAMGTLGYVLGVASRPSYESSLVRTTNYPDGSSEADVLSHTSQKGGGIEPVTIIQSRTTNWESQRKRQNDRGVAPALAGAGAVRFLAPR